jgi:DNA (cytosine-5)-methyltransferase 1
MTKRVQVKIPAPTVLDIFCGAGGMSLGFQNAGCKILGGIDNNPHAVRTHHRNFPNCRLKLAERDISSLDLRKLPIKPNEVDILIGGPPCQVFSRVGIGKMKSLGKLIEEDPRNFLYKDFVRCLQYYSPLFFVMENVDYLFKKKNAFPKILKSLELGLPGQREGYRGYRIHHGVLTASDYGVPQIRKRLFMVGVRQDLELEFEFPRVLRKKPISVGEAISDLIPLTPPYISLREKSSGPQQTDVIKPYLSPPQSEYQRKMRKKITKREAPDGVMNHICRSHNPVDLICFAMLTPGGKYLDLPESMRRYRWDIFEDKYKRLPWDKPAWTLTAHMKKDCLAYIHPKQNRSISVREAARLQSFPDDFVFDAPMTRMFELVGNSVPPLLAEA